MKRCSFQKRFLSKFLTAVTRRGVRPSQKTTSTRRRSWKEPLKISFQLILKSQYKFIIRALWKHIGFALKKERQLHWCHGNQSPLGSNSTKITNTDFEWLVCQLGQDDQENWKFKRKEKEEEKMIHKNFSKFYSFDIYVTFS